MSTIQGVAIGLGEDSDYSPIPEGTPLSGVFRMEYLDWADVRTVRSIDVRAHAIVEGKHWLVAYCRLRQARRAFRFEGIQELIDTATGEIVTELCGQEIGKEAILLRATLEGAWAKKLPEVDILLFVGTLSAGLRDTQIKIIVDHLARDEVLAKFVGVLPSMVKRRHAPNPVRFRECLKMLEPLQGQQVREVAEAILVKTKRKADLDRGVLEAIDKWRLK